MARYDRTTPSGLDDDDSEDEVAGSHAAAHKAKPRRKSHQRPQGSDQVRQAFSKRKKGLVLKAFQLNALTDAKVFMFIVNDKGTSWAYATPGFSASLNPELLKELRLIAQVPEQAKLVTEVMPDPSAAKTPDTACGSEQGAVRRADQIPTRDAPPCTRAATGSLPGRSRSSCSGGSADDAPGPELAPLARAGSTTTTRAQSTVQSDEHSPSKVYRGRPPSGSSMACGRPGSAAAHSQLYQQRPGGKPGKPGSMEPPTPCGVYNLMAGQTTGAVNDSPTMVSEVAASSASPSSRHHMVAPDFAGGSRAPAVENAADNTSGDLHAMQMMQAQQQQQQQQLWQQQAGIPQWDVPHQQQQNMQQLSWGMYQQQYGASGGEGADSWVAVTISGPAHPAAGQHSSIDCKPPLLQQHQQQLRSYASDPSQMASIAAQMGVGSSMQGWQQEMYAPAAGAADSNGQGAFENVMRGLPPLRVSRSSLQPDPDGARSAPAGVNSMPGQQVQWTDFEPKPEYGVHHHLRKGSDAAAYASSSGYSSYQQSPTYAQQEQTANGCPAGQPGRYAMVPRGATSAAAAAMMGQHDPHSASNSPTAALSQQMVSILAVDSPMHAAAMQQQQQPSHGQVGGGCQQSQMLQQQHNQGAYIPRTDDLIADPLMDMLMDQAVGASAGPLAMPSQRQPQQWTCSPQLSMMEATGQHTELNLKQEGAMQQQVDPFLQQGSLVQQQQYSQQHQQAEQVTIPQEQYTPQMFSQKQQFLGQVWQPASPAAIYTGSSSMRPPVAPGQQRYSGNYLKMMDMLKRMPLVTDPGRKAWEEQVKQLKTTLAPHESEEFSAYVRAQLLSKEGSSAGSNAAGMQGASGGYMLRALAAQGGKRLGPSRLSATVSQSMDAAAAAAVEAAASTSAAMGAMAGSNMPLMSQPVMVGGQAARSSTAMAFDAAVSSLALGNLGPGQMVPAAGRTAQQQQQLSQCDRTLSAAVAPHLVTTEGAGRTASAPLPSTAGLLGEMLAARNAHCSSPLKRSQGSLGAPVSNVFDQEVEESMSPMKKACRDLLEPPCFATLMHTELGEDDAVAWATSAAANDSLRAAGSFNSGGSLTKYDSVNRFGSLNNCDSTGSLAGFGAPQAQQSAAAAGGCTAQLFMTPMEGVGQDASLMQASVGQQAAATAVAELGDAAAAAARADVQVIDARTADELNASAAASGSDGMSGGGDAGKFTAVAATAAASGAGMQCD